MAKQNAVNNSLAEQEGTGKFVGDVSPTLTTPDIGAATGTSLNLGASTLINGFIDDDTFASASATTGATSESIKNYANEKAGFTEIIVELAASPYTWNKPAGFTADSFIEAWVVGAGGGSGGVAATTVSGQSSSSGAGGAGAVGYKKIMSGDLGATETVTVGAGGAGGAAGANDGSAGGVSSFGSIVTANGGFPGIGGSASTGSVYASGGGSAAVSGADIGLQGGAGGNGTVINGRVAACNMGGGNSFSSMKRAFTQPIGGVAANPGSFPGGGASGGNLNASIGTFSAKAGAVGGAGLVIIREYI